ncbi:DapH/DapD/GlmU-related protein [Rhodococcus sp. P1Y]|uniref:DapH/DapD/GlmU-related protein n=1 Tax=Rhodococcus sp. P1Y TaxID=1302308 RepID=UPI001F1A4E3C|nr:DapH/DapD/GlmU-related protein [Rhodococcus sp. P1Y]
MITIGDDTRIGPGAQLMTALHPVDDHRRRREGWERAHPITVGDNVWLGAAVTVGAGVTIGRNSVIGAGSVVLHDIPDHVVAAGSPAAILRSTPKE